MLSWRYLLISTVMLQSGTFSKAIAYTGILACAITVANDVSVVAAPSVAALLMPLNGLLWLVWWLSISGKLLQLGRKP